MTDNDQSQSPKDGSEESSGNADAEASVAAPAGVIFGALIGFTVGNAILPDGLWILSGGTVLAIPGAFIGICLSQLYIRIRGKE